MSEKPPPDEGTSSLQAAALGLLTADALVGAGISALMTWHHETYLYGPEKPDLIGCVESATVNCDIVNTSAWSELLSVPIATWSLAAYGTVGVLAILALTGRRGAHPVLVIAGVIATLCSAFLFWQSKVELGYVCAWCLRLYGVNFGILALSLLAGLPKLPFDINMFGGAAGIMAALSLVSVGGQRAYRASLLGDSPVSAALEAPPVAEAAKADPGGPAPAASFTVVTELKGEDGQFVQATLALEPDDAWKGNPNSKVAVVEFADLQCGFCKRMSSEIERLYAAYGDRVLFVFKHFPMDPACNPGVKNKKHQYACNAAVASVCAKEQGHFWDFAALSFKNQHQLGTDYLREYAATVGVDPVKFDACIKSPSTVAQVRGDATAGAALNIKGTPRIYINGKLYRSGTSAEAMAKAIEEALGATAQDAAKSAAQLHSEDKVAPIPADVPEMRAVAFGDLSFRIDTFEASVQGGRAVVGKHLVPSIRTSWTQADAACKAAGKRMCTEEEWVSACQNARAVDENKNGEFADDMIEGTAYPYGDFHEGGRCWDDHENTPQTPEPFRPVYTGEMPGCVTPTGIYDMTGNVEEWAGATPETAVLLGGAFDTSEDHARCYRRNDTYGPGYANPRTGFRCCQ